MALKLGIDTGGTYTDAVLVNRDQQVVAWAKARTTAHDLSIGVDAAIAAVMQQVQSPIELVSLSTTLATNALIEAESAPVCLILAGFSAQQAQRPELQAVMGNDPLVVVSGGHSAEGDELRALDVEAVRAAVAEHAPKVSAFAISSLFAVRNPQHERAIQAIVQEQTALPVSCGHALSSQLNGAKRALTAVVNARLIPLINALLNATQQVLQARDISAPLMVVKGDGSLISADTARATPVETILSGPASSLVGASHLCDLRDAVVADMGGTTTDVATLVDGKPKIDPLGAMVGNHRTMVQAVQMRTYALGGDSEVVFQRTQKDIKIGPRRAVPLSVLASDYPQVLETLEQQAKAEFPHTLDGQFLLRRRTSLTQLELTPRQQQLWVQLQDKPVALSQLPRELSSGHTLERLTNLGLVIKSCFTPTDACHVLGSQQQWNTHAAMLGAAILSRYSAQHRGPSWENTEHFAQTIVKRVSLQAAEHLLQSAFAETFGEQAPLSADHSTLFKLALEPRANAALQASFSLSAPLIALGAPAASYFEASAQQCNTPVDIPEFAQVSNAVGAVVGVVCQQVHALITPLTLPRVRVYIDTRQREFNTLAEAASWCEDELSNRARKQALAVGAMEPDVCCTREDTVTNHDDEQLFVQSILTATATGRPAAAKPH